MAASEIRRAIVGRIPDCLRNCVNKEYFPTNVPYAAVPPTAPDGKIIFFFYFLKLSENYEYFLFKNQNLIILFSYYIERRT